MVNLFCEAAKFTLPSFENLPARPYRSVYVLQRGRVAVNTVLSQAAAGLATLYLLRPAMTSCYQLSSSQLTFHPPTILISKT